MVGDGEGLTLITEGVERGVRVVALSVGVVVAIGAGLCETTVPVEESAPPKHPESTHAAQAAVKEIIIDFRIGKY